MVDLIVFLSIVAFFIVQVLKKKWSVLIKVLVCIVLGELSIIMIISYINSPYSIMNYESRLESYNQEAKEIENELNEIIVNYSDIKSYDYTKLLSKMSYRKLIETYLPELIMPTKTKRGYSYETKVGKLLDKYDDIQEKIKYLERKYESE